MNDLIQNGNSRFTVFPIQYPNLWAFYQKHLSTFWTTSEVLLTDDLTDWKEKLNDNERFFIKNVLAFFAASDGVVNENLVQNFYTEVQIPEARQFYSVQMMLEAIHGEQYALLIDTYISDKQEQNFLFNAIDNIPAVKRKAEWAIKYIEEGSTVQASLPKGHLDSLKELQQLLQNNPDCSPEHLKALDNLTRDRPSFGQRLLAFVCVEGIFFSGSFCAVYWLKSRGLMPGLCTANEFVAKDENLHAEFAIELYKTFVKEPLSEDIVHNIFKDAVDIEKEFITESLPVSLLGMNSNLMKQYIEYVADRWLVMLGYNKIWNVEQPFGFMEMLSLNTKENFFESRGTNYSRSGVGYTEEDNTIGFDEDF